MLAERFTFEAPVTEPQPLAAIHDILAAILTAVSTNRNVTIDLFITEAKTAVPIEKPRSGRLTPLQERIVALLSKDKPAKCEWLAAKLGKNCGGYFRSLCADLERMGVARHVKSVGYFLA